jgi:hypothetical protein
MMQIGNLEPCTMLSSAGQPAHLDKFPGRTSFDGERLAAAPTAEAEDGTLFVTPPPLPWPRIFPGL